MKTKLLLLTILFSYVFSFGQITLEHTYSDGPVERIKLESSGEKYFSVDYATKEIHFFNANHTPWKTIALPIPANTSNIFISSVSEHKINADDNIEIVFSYYYSNNGFFTAGMVVSEDETVLLSVPNVNFMTLSEIEGAPSKIIAVKSYNLISPIAYTSKVFSTEDFSLENSYDNGQAIRIFLENAGEKYYIYDKVGGGLMLYNSDHSYWKTINLPKPAASNYYGAINFISQTQINADDAIEVGYISLNSENVLQFEGKIVNDNNETLLTIPNANFLSINAIEGLPNKLMSSVFNVGNYNSTKVFTVPELTEEHSYVINVDRMKLESSGEKYFTTNIENGELLLYNNNHTLWKTINLVPTEGGAYYGIGHISEHKVNDDDLIEVAYYGGNLDQAGSAVINENGDVLASISSGEYIWLSELPGLENKFILRMAYPGNYGTVYSLENLGTNSLTKNTITIYPNPSDKLFKIQSDTPINQIDIYDIKSVLIRQEKASAITEIDTDALFEGIYFLHLTDENFNKSIQKLIISR